MTNAPSNETGKPSPAIYQITIQGVLMEDWRDWFNGMLVATDYKSSEDSSTSFTCKVRDQSELVGIINWLHNMNLIIKSVVMIPPGSESEIDIKNNQ